MVHRPADSRLLANLLQQEKDYLKQLNQLFNSSSTSLDSFTAYAAASPPPASQVILAVAGLLAAADDALKHYALGVEQWGDSMRLLKDMEDEVGNVMRDREILVTRLIKVSKSHKPNSGTFRVIGSHQQFPSSSSLSLSAGNQESPSPSRPVSASFPTSTKLAAAQTELQACETQLAAKEAELALRRCAAVREGLGARAKAMIDCSGAWGQLGRQILRSLDDLGNYKAHRNDPEHGATRPHDDPYPVPNSTRPSSDFSSLSPSQSASQTHRDGQQLPEPINLIPAVMNMDSGQSTHDNTVLDAKRLSVPTMPRPYSAASTAASSITPAMPTTYKLETVTYAPAILVVPGKDVLSSSLPPPILGSGSNTPLSSLGPPLDTALTPHALATEEESLTEQGLHTKMHIPAAYAINEYAIPTAKAAGSESGAGNSTARRRSRENSQERSTRMDYFAPKPWLQVPSSVASAPEPNSRFFNAMSSSSTLHPPRHILERRITEEELRGNDSSTVDVSHGGGGQIAGTSRVATSALVEVFDDSENDNDDDDDDDDLPIKVEHQLIQQGKLAVVENPRFMSEERKRELQRERERMKVASVKEGQEQESELGPVKEKTRFSFLYHPQQNAVTPTPAHGRTQSQSDTGHFTSATSLTPKTSPSKTNGSVPYTSPTKTSPSKRLLGSLRGLFGVRQPVSPQVQDCSPSPSRFGTRPRVHSPSRIRTVDNPDVDTDSDSDVDSPSKVGGGLQALFRGPGAKKKASGTRWSTRTDRNVRKLTRTGGLDDDLDGHISQVVGNGSGVAGNAVAKAGLVGAGSVGPGGRKRSASDIGVGVSTPGGSAKDVTRGGKRLKKAPSPFAAAPAPALYISPQQNNGAAPSMPMRKSSLTRNAPGERSASVDEGVRQTGVQQSEVGQTPVVNGGQGRVVDLGQRRKRAVSDTAGPLASGKGSVIFTTNVPVGAPVRAAEKLPMAGTSKGYSSDTAAAVSASPLVGKKSVTRNAVLAPAPASIPAATATPAATSTPSRPTPARKTSIGKTQTYTTPNIPSQPHPQPRQYPASHVASSSGGGAIVLPAGGTHPSGTLISHPGWDAQALPTPGGGLSRNNSILSVVSAPAGGSGGGMSKTKKQKQTVLGHGMGSGTSLRRNSLGSSGHAGGEKKTAAPDGSSTGPTVQPATSLMSIVEDVARHNREWNQESSQLLKNKNKSVGELEKGKSAVRMVDVVKAPPRIGREELAQLNPATIKGRVMEISMNLAPGTVTGTSDGSGADTQGKTRLIDSKAPGSVFDQRIATKLGSVPATVGMDVVKAPLRIGREELEQLDLATIKRRVMETSTMDMAAGAVSGGVRLVDIKAPGSVFDQRNANNLMSAPAAQQGMHRQASNSTPNLTQSQQAYHSSLTRRASVTVIPDATATPVSRRPAKSPLRSVLKSQSRTPSPGPFLVPHLQKQQEYLQQEALQEKSQSNISMVAPVPISPTLLPTIAVSRQPSLTRSPTTNNRTTTKVPSTASNGRAVSYDSASQRRKGMAKNKAAVSAEVGESGDAEDSASTNDSGNEIFFTDDEDHDSEHVVVTRPMLNGHVTGYTATGIIGSTSELSHSTTSAAVVHRPILHAPQPTTSPQKRKSVRVSLQPTFSPSPPAIEYDDDEEQKYHAPWVWRQDYHKGSGQHVHAPIPVAATTSHFLNSSHRQQVVAPEQPSPYVYDIWENSSDEEMEYQKAKVLLTRAARNEKDMKAFTTGRRQ